MGINLDRLQRSVIGRLADPQPRKISRPADCKITRVPDDTRVAAS